MFCRYCGQELADDSIFCHKCGRRLEGEPITPKEEEKAEVPQREEIPEQAEVPKQDAASEQRVKSKPEDELKQAELPGIEGTKKEKGHFGKKKIVPVCVIAGAVLALFAVIAVVAGRGSESRYNQEKWGKQSESEEEKGEYRDKAETNKVVTDSWGNREEPVVSTITIRGKTYATDIESLDLSGAMLTDRDIEPLAQLTELRTINLNDNQLTDLSVLSMATKLETVTFNNNNVSEIGFVEYMDNLTVISGEYNQVSDISPLAGKSNLTDVFFGNNQVTDISPLADCEALINVGFNEASLSDINALAGKSDLKMVCFHNCGLTDISPLAGCTNLTQVYFGANQIADVSPLQSAKSMEDVWLDNNRLSANPESFKGLTVNGQIAIYGNDLTELDQVKIRDRMYGNFTIYGTSLEGNTPKPEETVTVTVAPKPTSKPKATATPKPTSKPKATATPKPTSKPKATATPKTTAYSRTSRLTNQTLTATAGKATIIGRRENRVNELLILPDFAAWTGNEFAGGGDGTSGTFESYTKRCGKQPDLQLAKDYIAMLESKYGATMNMTVNSDPDYIGKFTYKWTGTVGTATVEIELMGLTEGFTEYFIINTSEKIYLADTGERASGNNTTSILSKLTDYENTYTVTPKYNVQSGNNTILMAAAGGFGAPGFSLTPDYTKGKKLGVDDFSGQMYYDYPESTCFFAYNDIEKDKVYGTYHTTWEQMEHLEVEVLENKNGYQTLYFYMVFTDGQYYRYYIEGVCAPGTNDIPTYPTVSGGGNSGGSSGGTTGGSAGITVPSISTNTHRCAVCDGDGWMDCFSCGGNGYKMCTLCHGTGTYRMYGQSSDCSCLDGDVRCSSCSGRGEKRCTGCGGDGYY